MQDLSLHLLDIVENSIRARATQITIEIWEEITNNKLRLVVIDNGKGMSEEMVHQVRDPFVTSRTTRRVGLGIPLLYQNCLQAEGDLKIQSEEGKGTRLEAEMVYNHVDCLPLGDMASTLILLIQANPTIEFVYQHVYEEKTFVLNTVKIKHLLGEVEISNPEIIQWLKAYMTGQLVDLRNQ